MPEIINDIKQFESVKQIGITTNGLVLHKKLQVLKESGLTNINISLDTLVEAKFEFLTRRLGFKQVIKVNILFN